jgi:hypothetical protein
MTWLRRIFARKQIHADLSAEVHTHLDETVEEFVAAGMPRKEAEHAARVDPAAALRNE